MTDADLNRVAADLDHIRSLGPFAPCRQESLRIAAAVLRSITSGDLSRALAALIAREGGTLPPAVTATEAPHGR